jgi:hypothetical protein
MGREDSALQGILGIVEHGNILKAILNRLNHPEEFPQVTEETETIEDLLLEITLGNPEVRDTGVIMVIVLLLDLRLEDIPE